ncbi:MAG: amidohydrolase family protein [Acidobacteria bacterium]|nr:amidohydrolase family protein [Acidobacteriota bacterium]
MTDLDRRHFLAGALATLGLATTTRGGHSVLSAQATATGGGRIDVHHHFSPPAWIAEVAGRPLLNPANPRWTPEQSIEDMDRGGAAAAMISITNPGLYFGDAAVTRRLARACNEYGAELVQRFPTRFGLFAAMPLPDVDATLAEIEYAYDTLNVDGVGLMTSYDDNMWLGDPAFRPVMADLDRRRAVVHVHPTAANCCRNLTYGVAPGSMEYGTDTSRAIVGVAFSGDAAMFPNVRFIWSHAGGSLPFLAGRIDGASANAADRLPEGFLEQARRFYYDTAGAANRGALVSLLELVNADHILFGTDFPPGGTIQDTAAALRSLNLFSDADLRAIDRDNVVRLIPRLGNS